MLGGLRLVLSFQLVDAQHDIPCDLGKRAVEVNALRRGGEGRRLTLEHRTDLRFRNIRAVSVHYKFLHAFNELVNVVRPREILQKEHGLARESDDTRAEADVRGVYVERDERRDIVAAAGKRRQAEPQRVDRLGEIGVDRIAGILPRVTGVGDEKPVGSQCMRAFEIVEQPRCKIAVHGVKVAEIDRQAGIGKRRAVVLEQKRPVLFREAPDIHEDERAVAQTAAAVDTIIDGVRQSANIAIPTGVCGIMIGIVVRSGIAVKIAKLIGQAGGSSLLLALIVAAIGCLLLGMALPTVAAYLIANTLFCSAIMGLGVETLVANMFIFYFGVIAQITPPVCLASFTAAGIAKASAWKTGWKAFACAMGFGLIAYCVITGKKMEAAEKLAQ